MAAASSLVLRTILPSDSSQPSRHDWDEVVMVSSALRRATERAATIERLQQSLASVLYAVAIIPDAWHSRTPDDDPALAWLGSWSVAENLAHLAVYEELVAAPILEAIAAGRDGSADVASVIEHDYEALWQELSAAPIDEIADRLAAARARQTAAVAAMSDERFQALATSLWQPDPAQAGHSAAWVATKTIQHTWEHGDAIFRIALFAPHHDEAPPANTAAPAGADAR